MEKHFNFSLSYIKSYIKSFLAGRNWYFGQYEKAIFCKTAIETLFAFTDCMSYAKSQVVTWRGMCGRTETEILETSWKYWKQQRRPPGRNEGEGLP